MYCVCTYCVAIAIVSEHGELGYSKVYSLAVEWSEVVFSNRAPYYISHGAGSKTKSLKAVQKKHLASTRSKRPVRDCKSSVRNVWIGVVRRKGRISVRAFESHSERLWSLRAFALNVKVNRYRTAAQFYFDSESCLDNSSRKTENFPRLQTFR